MKKSSIFTTSIRKCGGGGTCLKLSRLLAVFLLLIPFFSCGTEESPEPTAPVSIARIYAPQELHDPQNLLTYSDGIYTAKNGYSSYMWWLDGSITSITAKTLEVKNMSLSAGAHTVMLVVSDDAGTVYSATAVFVLN